MDVVRLDAYKALPIPEWLHLRCRQCGYALRGLPEHCCPECGWRFNIDEMITDTDPLRPPQITSETRPIPEMGFTCDACDASLTGATADRCPACGERFNLEDFIPEAPWPALDLICTNLEKRLIRYQLREAGLPISAFDTHEEPAAAIQASVTLLIRRDYYLDALCLIYQSGAINTSPWTCPNCGQDVPANFEICWKCQTPRTDDTAKAS